MKTSGDLVGGTLRADAYAPFAEYLVRYVEAYRAEAVPIYALTVQNEPGFAPKDYPGMKLSAAARAKLIGGHLGPLLAQRAPETKILDWDHNWDKPEEPMAVLADPDHAWKFGTSVRVSAGRDVFLENVKDEAIAMYARPVAVRVLERVQAIGDFDAITEDRVRTLASRYRLDYLVTDRTMSLPVAYRNDRFTIYRLGANGNLEETRSIAGR